MNASNMPGKFLEFLFRSFSFTERLSLWRLDFSCVFGFAQLAGCAFFIVAVLNSILGEMGVPYVF